MKLQVGNRSDASKKARVAGIKPTGPAVPRGRELHLIGRDLLDVCTGALVVRGYVFDR